MKFAIDECVGRVIDQALAAAGFDCARAPAGVSDRQVLQFAAQEGRIIITDDTDFGQLCVVDRVPVAAVILLRMSGWPVADQAERLVAMLRAEPPGHEFVVLDPQRVRRRALVVL